MRGVYSRVVSGLSDLFIDAMASAVHCTILSCHNRLDGGLVADVAGESRHLRNNDNDLELLTIPGCHEDTVNEGLRNLVLDWSIILRC